MLSDLAPPGLLASPALATRGTVLWLNCLHMCLSVSPARTHTRTYVPSVACEIEIARVIVPLERPSVRPRA